MHPAPTAPPAVMSRQEVRAFDAWAIGDLGVPGVVLMENAGRGCAEAIQAYYGGGGARRVAILCGTGNNGGDGFVVARHLVHRGHRVRVYLCGDRSRVHGDAELHLAIWERLHGPAEALVTGGLDLSPADLVVDALLGTGLSGPLRSPYPGLIESINACGRPILAVDIPSGLDCDTGRPLGGAIRADRTVTFVRPKPGFLTDTGRAYTGPVTVAGIGVEPTDRPAR